MKNGEVNPIDARLGHNLRALRELKGKTRLDLATALGMTQQNVEKYENGSNGMAGRVMADIAAYFEVPVSTLFDGMNLPEEDTGEMLRAATFMRNWQGIGNEEIQDAIGRCVKAISIEVAQIMTGKKERPL
jgi:transcriptional regulator with XRE-family HTH domain